MNSGRRVTVGLVIVLVLFLSVPASTLARESDLRDPRQYFFIQSFGDLPEEVQNAKREGKHGLLLFFEAEDCKYCKAMLGGVLSEKTVQDFYREHFLSIAIDIHGDVEIKDLDGITLPSKVFAEHRRVFMTPVVSFLDLDGREVYRHLGMIKTAEEFLAMGEYIAEKHYFDTEFRVFAESKNLQEGIEGPATAVTEHANQD